MDLLDLIMEVEENGLDFSNQEQLAAVGHHRDTLRQLQGYWGRLVAQLEDEGYI